MVYLRTQDFLFNWIYVRDILVVKSELTTEVLGGRGSPTPMGWVVPLYDKKYARMERSCMDATDMGSSEDDY